MKTFFDSSALAKRYVQERGSEDVEDLCMAATELAVSVICVPEVISALSRRVREKHLSRSDYAHAKQHLLDDLRDAVIVNLTPAVVAASVAMLESSALRAMDALHVGCALEWGAELFVSADKKQIPAARKQGLHARSV